MVALANYSQVVRITCLHTISFCFQPYFVDLIFLWLATALIFDWRAHKTPCYKYINKYIYKHRSVNPDLGPVSHLRPRKEVNARALLVRHVNSDECKMLRRKD